MTDHSIEQIAAKLTEAQRSALTACFQDRRRHAPYHVFPNNFSNRRAFRDLIVGGFVSGDDGGFDLVIHRGRAIAMVILSPLGLAVRAHLMEEGR